MAYLSLSLAIYSLILTFFFLPESPRFLVSRKRFKEATLILKKISSINGVKNYEFTLDDGTKKERANSLSLKEKELEQAKDETQLNGTVRELFFIPVYRRNIIIMMITWSFGSFAFFMVPFYLKNVKANIYYLSLSMEGGEFLASVVCVFIQRWIELKRAILIFCLMIAMGSFGMLFIAKNMVDDDHSNDGGMFNIALILLTNLGIVSVFDIAYLINAELFPTILLATAYGSCNVLGRAITIFSPVAANLGQPYPLVILIFFAILCSVLSLLLTKIK
jgi:OCT family organic cation transporter-like MFS transporter 4/5